jgi:hypothetical protein
MNDAVGPTPLDRQLLRLFGTAGAEPTDAQFAAQVMRRIRRQLLIRRVVLSSAAVLGIAFGAGPLLQFLALTYDAILVLMHSVDRIGELEQYPLQLLATLLLVLGPGLIRWLER